VMSDPDPARDPSWLWEVALAESPRALELVHRDVWSWLGASSRLLIGFRCPACGRPIVALIARRYPTLAATHYLDAAPTCLHPLPGDPSPRRDS